LYFSDEKVAITLSTATSFHNLGDMYTTEICNWKMYS